MTKYDRSDMVILNVHVWRFLRYFDEMVEARDDRATSIMDAFLAPNKLSVDRHGEAVRLVKLPTTMGILLVTFLLGREIDADRWEGRLRKPADYDVCCGGSRCPKSPTIHQVICTMRNALAHAFDADGGTSVSFPGDGGFTFETSKGVVSRVTFRTKMGFETFIRDYVDAIQRFACEDFLRDILYMPTDQVALARELRRRGAAGVDR